MADDKYRGVSIDEIRACSDLEVLCGWFMLADERELEQRAFLDAWRAAGIDDDDYYHRNAGALAYCAISKRHLERRILALGGMPPYSPADPRSRQLRILSDKLEKLQKRLNELEPPRPEPAEAGDR